MAGEELSGCGQALIPLHSGEILDDHSAPRDGHLSHQPLPQRQLPPRLGVIVGVRPRHESHPVALHRPQLAGPAGEEGDGGVHHRRHDGLRIE